MKIIYDIKKGKYRSIINVTISLLATPPGLLKSILKSKKIASIYYDIIMYLFEKRMQKVNNMMLIVSIFNFDGVLIYRKQTDKFNKVKKEIKDILKEKSFKKER